MTTSLPIYLDYNATTPLLPRVVAEMKAVLGSGCDLNLHGNPSSNHIYGRRAKNLVEKARGQVATLLNSHPSEIVFTSGGSESNNYAIKGVAFQCLFDQQREGRSHIITSKVEHPAVTEVCEYLRSTHNFEVTYVGVDEMGLVSEEDVLNAVTEKTCLVSIMHANNEIGTLQPIAAISAALRKRFPCVLMHSDASQSVGKVEVNVKSLGVHLLTVAAHKFYGPKGVGALYVEDGITLHKLIHGASHESGRRAGTENVISIVGMGAAASLALSCLEKRIEHMKETRDRLFDALNEKLKGHVKMRLNGHPEKRLPNTLNISFQGIDARKLLAELEDFVVASTGAACHSNPSHGPSGAIAAINVPPDFASGTLRLSTGEFTTLSDVNNVAHVLAAKVLALSLHDIR